MDVIIDSDELNITIKAKTIKEWNVMVSNLHVLLQESEG